MVDKRNVAVATATPKPLKQVAALPILPSPEGILRVLLITSRETRRWIIPKGWPMKGLKDPDAAAIEARQEAGVLGKIGKKAIGTYPYFKRLADHFDLIEVAVYPLLVTRQLEDWRERKDRTSIWLTPGLAADRVDEPELALVIRNADLASALKKLKG